MRLPRVPINIVRSLIDLATEDRSAPGSDGGNSRPRTVGSSLWLAYLATPPESLPRSDIVGLRSHWLAQSLLDNVRDLSLACPAYGPPADLFWAFFSDHEGDLGSGGRSTRETFDPRIDYVFVSGDRHSRSPTELISMMLEFGASLGEVVEVLGPLKRYNVPHNDDSTVFAFSPNPNGFYPSLQFVFSGDWQVQADGSYRHRLWQSPETRIVPAEAAVPATVEIRFLSRDARRRGR